MREVSAVVLFREEDEAVLLQHRDDIPGLQAAGLWVFPGGQRESGERNEDCARRECREEAGYECGLLFWLLDLYDTTYVPERKSPYILHIFWGIYDGQQQIQCLEGQDMRFVLKSEVTKIKIPPYLVSIWEIALEAFHHSKLIRKHN